MQGCLQRSRFSEKGAGLLAKVGVVKGDNNVMGLSGSLEVLLYCSGFSNSLQRVKKFFICHRFWELVIFTICIR